MMTRKSLFSFFFAFLWFSPTVQADSGVKVGSPAPPLTLKNVLQAPEEAHGTWEELRGKAVVVEFWATWCGPCVDDIPHLNELAEKFASRPLQFISVTDETDVELVKQFLADHPIRGWVAFDAEESTFKRYDIGGRPLTLLVDGAGIVRAVTNPISVTPQVLEDLLAAKPLNFPELRMGPLLGLEPGAPPPLMQVLIRPAAPVSVSGTSPGRVIDENGRYDAYGATLRSILSKAYEIPENRIDAPEWCSKSRFDYSVVTPQHEEALRWPLVKQALDATFRLKFHQEMKETRVYILRKVVGQEPKLRLATTEGESSQETRKGELLEAVGVSIGRLARIAHFVLDGEVIDETGLTGRYDFDLKWDSNQPTSIVAAIREQLGLELVVQQRKLDHLVVDSIAETKTW
jgi:uncharacterized protein (TIGR03435 family)